jgi:acetyltransferase
VGPIHRLTMMASAVRHQVAYAVEVIEVPSGELVTVRAIAPQDAPLMQAFVRGLSREARYNRFMRALGELSPALLDRLTRIDHVRHHALIATVEHGGNETVIAEARYVADEEPESCEFAIAVTDAWQGKGIGHRLAHLLARDAAACGFRHIVGHTLRDNDRMLHFGRREGFSMHTDHDDASLVRLDRDIVAHHQDTPALRRSSLTT